jgi:hypothetical protein
VLPEQPQAALLKVQQNGVRARATYAYAVVLGFLVRGGVHQPPHLGLELAVASEVSVHQLESQVISVQLPRL